MTGKEKCELMKGLRVLIAKKNGIDYLPENCDHGENCPGYCPQCDAEAAWLMEELKKKEKAGFPVQEALSFVENQKLIADYLASETSEPEEKKQ